MKRSLFVLALVCCSHVISQASDISHMPPQADCYAVGWNYRDRLSAKIMAPNCLKVGVQVTVQLMLEREPIEFTIISEETSPARCGCQTFKAVQCQKDTDHSGELTLKDHRGCLCTDHSYLWIASIGHPNDTERKRGGPTWHLRGCTNAEPAFFQEVRSTCEEVLPASCANATITAANGLKKGQKVCVNLLAEGQLLEFVLTEELTPISIKTFKACGCIFYNGTSWHETNSTNWAFELMDRSGCLCQNHEAQWEATIEPPYNDSAAPCWYVRGAPSNEKALENQGSLLATPPFVY